MIKNACSDKGILKSVVLMIVLKIGNN